MSSNTAIRRPRKQKVTEAQLAIRDGDSVVYKNDQGFAEALTAKSDPWQLGHGDWVIKLEGKSGGYDLSRVLPARTPAMSQ